VRGLRARLRVQHLLRHAGRAHEPVRGVQRLPGGLRVGLQVIDDLRRHCGVHARRQAHWNLGKRSVSGRALPTGTGCGRECSRALYWNKQLALAHGATSAPAFVPSGRSMWSAAAPGTGGTPPPFVREVFRTAGRIGFFWLFMLVPLERLVLIALSSNRCLKTNTRAANTLV